MEIADRRLVRVTLSAHEQPKMAIGCWLASSHGQGNRSPPTGDYAQQMQRRCSGRSVSFTKRVCCEQQAESLLSSATSDNVLPTWPWRKQRAEAYHHLKGQS